MRIMIKYSIKVLATKVIIMDDNFSFCFRYVQVNMGLKVSVLSNFNNMEEFVMVE